MHIWNKCCQLVIPRPNTLTQIKEQKRKRKIKQKTLPRQGAGAWFPRVFKVLFVGTSKLDAIEYRIYVGTARRVVERLQRRIIDPFTTKQVAFAS